MTPGRRSAHLFGCPSQAFGYTSAHITIPADRTKDRAKTGIGFNAPGRLGERPDSLRARGTVVGQKVKSGMLQHYEKFGFHPQVERVRIAARPSFRLHVTSIPANLDTDHYR